MTIGIPWKTITEIAYISLFFGSAVVCLGALLRARIIDDSEIKLGLMGLFASTGLWALLKTGYFLLSGPIRSVAYIVGLIFGFATVWAWLYFCSAYAGYGYHNNTTLRRLSVGVFLTIVAAKLTNPIHGLYFTTSEATQPFSHLAIEHGLLHWSVTALSYVLAGIGLFMLFHFYTRSGYNTRSLAVLTALLGLPVGLDIVAILIPELIDIIYAPFGVAAFAVGTLFVFEERFAAVGTTRDDDAATIFLDTRGYIRDYSDTAATTFPELAEGKGKPFNVVLPEVAAVIEDDDKRVIEREGETDTRYFVASTQSTSTHDSTVKVVTLSEVTELETQRRQLLQRERELAERNELHRAVIAATFAFVFRIDPDEHFSYVSESIEDVLDYTAEELTGEPMTTLIPNEQAISEAREQFENVLAGDGVEIQALPLETKYGRIIYTDIRAVPIYKPSVSPEDRTAEDIVGTQVMVRDATDRRQREGLISVINRVLRHNVRNKLTVIRGYGSTLEAELEGEQASNAKQILDTADRLLDLTESAREIEKNRELSPDLEEIDIVPLIEALVEELNDKYSQASVTVMLPETAVAKSLPRIETALWELLENAAVHGGDPAEIEIEVTLTEQQLTICIRDNGPGIPEQERQVLATGKEEPLVHGQGMGLFLTYWIVRNLNGDITVEKGYDGTTIEVRLPRALST